MHTYDLSQLGDAVVVRHLDAVVARHRASTAEMLAYIAEVDSRRLYVPAGYPSMFAYCVGHLRCSEDAASKRIHAARAARQFPAIFPAVADGRLHLSAVCLLAPHLTPANADGLIVAAVHKTKADVELLLASRFPRTESLPMEQRVPAPQPGVEHAPGHAGTGVEDSEHAPGHVQTTVQRSKATPCASDRYALQLMLSRATYEKLRHAQELLSHALRSSDVADVIDRALDALVTKLEKRKCAAMSRPVRRARSDRPASDAARRSPRHIPAEVKRPVRQRDGGRCTFVSEDGHSCESRTLLELDHVDPVARGGRATVDGMRLRCRAHNQFEAECLFGAGFMAEKREEARRMREEKRAAAASRRVAPAADTKVALEPQEAEERAEDSDEDLAAALRELGFRTTEVRRGLEHCRALPHVSLEEQVRSALRVLCRRPRVHAGSALGT